MASKLKPNNGVILKSALGIIALGISAIIIWLCGRAFAHEARIVGVEVGIEKDAVHMQATIDDIKGDVSDLCTEQRQLRDEQRDGFKELAQKIEALKP